VVLALRHLGMARVPSSRIAFKKALKQYRIDMFMSGLLTGIGLDVDDLMVGARVECNWRLYWLRHHPDEEERAASNEKYVRLATVINRVNGVEDD
jgi:hypothetical protein